MPSFKFDRQEVKESSHTTPTERVCAENHKLIYKGITNAKCLAFA